jgi:hypothetical protein
VTFPTDVLIRNAVLKAYADFAVNAWARFFEITAASDAEDDFNRTLKSFVADMSGVGDFGAGMLLRQMQKEFLKLPATATQERRQLAQQAFVNGLIAQSYQLKTRVSLLGNPANATEEDLAVFAAIQDAAREQGRWRVGLERARNAGVCFNCAKDVPREAVGCPHCGAPLAVSP